MEVISSVDDQKPLLQQHLQAVHRIIDIVSPPGLIQDRFLQVLEAVKDALEIERVALLVVDPDGVMRFKACIGLSDSFRAAMEGLSPWKADVVNPQPILVQDVRTQQQWAPMMEVLESENIRGVGFIPLKCQDRLIGKFMLYYDQPHFFDHEEVELALAIAALVGFAIERNENMNKVMESGQKIQSILESISDAFYAVDRDWKFTYVNRRALELWGKEEQEIVGKSVWEIFPDAVETAAYEAHLRVMREGRPLELEYCSTILKTWLDLKIFPSESGLAVYFRDISDRKRTEQALAEVQRRSMFLSEASNLLASSLDYETTLQSIADLCVPQLADLCTVHILEEDRSIRPVAIAHIDSWKASGNNLQDYLPPRRDSGPGKVLLTGEPELLNYAEPQKMNLYVKNAGQIELVRAIDLKSYICVPLVARGRAIGTLSFVSTNPDRVYTQNDLLLAEGLASRAAMAVDNARLFQETKESREVIFAQLKEKEVLIKEIHHRVKNNLQIISSLLNLQASQDSGNSKDLLKESQNRVRTMALIHEKLYQSDLSKLDLGDYLKDLAQTLHYSFGALKDRIKLELDCEAILVDLDKAVPCGLIVNEIVSNCLKHAFPNERSGKISIRFRHGEDQFRLDISDDGIGMPPSIDLDHEKSLGLRLVVMLVRQLDGQVKLERLEQGTRFQITFH